MRASIQAVAEEAGVSVSTVSRAFAKPDLVLPATRAKVMKAARKLDYRISRSASALKSGQSFRVALLTSGESTSWFNAHVFAGLNSVLHPAGYDISMFEMNSASQRREFFANLPVQRNADAVVVNSFNIDPKEVSRLAEMGVPIIGINVPGTDGFDATVSIDDRASMAAAAEHLVSIGHRRIAYVDGIDRVSDGLEYSASQRLEGFKDVCRRHPDVEPQLVSITHDRLFANTVANHILSASPAPTAVCFQYDEFAIPVLCRLRQFGRRIPEDLSVTGFDDIGLAEQIGLTTLKQDPRATGELAGRKVLAAIDGEAMDTPHETFPARLMLRETTAPV